MGGGSAPRPKDPWEYMDMTQEEWVAQQNEFREAELAAMEAARESQRRQAEAAERQAALAEQQYQEAQEALRQQQEEAAAEESRLAQEEKDRLALTSGAGANPTLLTGGQGVQLSQTQQDENLRKQQLGSGPSSGTMG